MFIWPITKAVGDHYLLPGALTARRARARTEKNRLEYATSKREMCRKGWTGKQGERRRERDRIQTDIILQPHFLVWGRDMTEWIQRDKCWEKDVLQMCFSIYLQFFTPTSICSVWRAEILQMIANFAGTGGVTGSWLWGLPPGWWTSSQSEAVCESATQLYESVALCYVHIMTAPPRKRLWVKRLLK